MNEKQLKSSFTFNQVVKLLPLFSCSRFLFLFYFSTFLFRLNAWVRVFLSLPSFLRMIFRLHSETMVNEFFFYINNHKIKYWQNMSLASLNRCFQRNNVILIWQNFCVWIAFFTASIIISVLFFFALAKSNLLPSALIGLVRSNWTLDVPILSCGYKNESNKKKLSSFLLVF